MPSADIGGATVLRDLAVALLLLLAGCSSSGPSGVGFGPPGMDVAQAALREGSPEIALQIVTNILAKNPNNEAALLTQGEAYTALGRPEEASASFSTVLAGDPESVGAHIGLGRLRLASDPAAAEALFLEALSREPRNAVALNDLGIARDLQRRHSEAQAAYRQALGVKPDLAAAQVNLALSLAMSGQSRDAIHILRPLAEAPSATVQVRHDLAAVLAMGGDRTAAEQILSKDLPPNEVQQALSGYDASRSNPAGALLAAGGTPAETAVSLPLLAANRISVRIGDAARSRDAASGEWHRLQQILPNLFGARQLTILRTGGGWQLHAEGFASAVEADAFCDQVRAAGTTCSPVQ
jgi:Flp pilus assembly protein TadD